MAGRGGINSFRSIKVTVRSCEQPGNVGLVPEYFEMFHSISDFRAVARQKIYPVALISGTSGI